MSKVEAPTKAEIEALMEDIRNRRTAYLDKYGLFGGGELINMKLDVLNKMWDKLKLQLDVIEAHEQAIRDSPGAGTQDDINWKD